MQKHAYFFCFCIANFDNFGPSAIRPLVNTAGPVLRWPDLGGAITCHSWADIQYNIS